MIPLSHFVYIWLVVKKFTCVEISKHSFTNNVYILITLNHFPKNFGLGFTSKFMLLVIIDSWHMQLIFQICENLYRLVHRVLPSLLPVSKSARS